MITTPTGTTIMDGVRNATGGAIARGAYDNRSADSTAAAVTRSQWQHFLDTYRDVESEVLSEAMRTDFSAEGDKAGQDVASSLAAAAGTAERNLSRSGVALSGEERAALARRRNLSLTKGVSRAENTTRRGAREGRDQLLRGIVNIGRGVSNTASGGLQSAANLEAQRNMGNAARGAQARNTNMSTAAALAMAVIAGI